MNKERDWIVIGDTNDHPVLAFIVLNTGQCGTESREVQLWPAGSGNDALLWQMAKDNAESFNIFPSSEYEEDEQDDDDADYTDNIEGNAYLFHPDNLSSTYETAHQILEWLQELKAITWNQSTISNSIDIHLDIISKVMNYDFDSFCEMIEHSISGEFYISEYGPNRKSRTIGEAEIDCRPAVINSDRLFGGYSIKDIQKNIDDNYVVEKSNAIISDLIAYIRELEQK